MRSALIIALALAGGMPRPAFAETMGTTTAALKARCTQLVAYYDRYGVGRSTNSDGRRNHTRIGAEIDCSRGLYAQGISAMLGLLERKKFTPPPSPAAPNEPEDDN
ncbi:hypothetical protein BH11PSE3_BH11PSE3_42120 [soil metagenome]